MLTQLEHLICNVWTDQVGINNLNWLKHNEHKNKRWNGLKRDSRTN